MRINSKNKGNKAERVVCKILSKWSNKEFSRVPASGGLRWKKTDNIAGDITCSEPNHLCYLSFEIKSYKNINFADLLVLPKNIDILTFWNQARQDAKRAKKVPLLFMRYNRLPKDFYFVVMTSSLYKEVKLRNIKLRNFIRYKDLIITSTRDLISLPYKDLNISAKSLVKNER